MRSYSYHDRPIESLKADVWNLILEQSQTLQSEMSDVGYLTLKGSSTVVDGNLRSAGVIFIDQSGRTQTGNALDFEEDVCQITINLRARSYDIEENAEDAPSFQDAADYLVDNIAAYMTVCAAADQPIQKVDVVLSAKDGLTITANGQPEPWAQPGVVDTPEAMRDFFQAEIDAVSERIGDRYLAYAQRQLDAWSAQWPEAHFDLGLINGSTLLSADIPGGRRQLLNHWRDAQIDEEFPGLAAKLEALTDLEGELECRVMPAINGTRLKPTAVPDEAPDEEPDESPSP